MEYGRNEWVEPPDEIGDRQHVNHDGETDALKGARMAGIGSAIAGGVAGSVIGPVGTLAGAVIGAVAGTIAGGVAVGAVDKVDGDSSTDHPHDSIDTQSGGYAFERPLTAVNLEHPSGLQPLTPYYDVYEEPQDGNTTDTRSAAERMADTITGDNVDDSTGKRVS